MMNILMVLRNVSCVKHPVRSALDLRWMTASAAREQDSLTVVVVLCNAPGENLNSKSNVICAITPAGTAVEVNLTNALLVEQTDEGWTVFCTVGSAEKAVPQVTTIQSTPVYPALVTAKCAWILNTAKDVPEDTTLTKIYVRSIAVEKVNWKILTLKTVCLVQKDARTVNLMTQESA